MDETFDSKTIRYLYISMIIAGLAFTGKITLNCLLTLQAHTASQ